MHFVQSCKFLNYRLIQYSRVLPRQSSFLPVQGVGVTLNVPTLEEAPCCHKRVAVNDLSLGQVHLMACGPYMLYGICSHLSA